MENWSPTMAFEVGYAKHIELVARGESNFRQQGEGGTQRPRVRLAALLIALAARLDPARTPALAPSVPA